MASLHIRTLASAIALTTLAGAMQPAWATLPISTDPLVIPAPPPPAFIMAFDNSGSIGSDETLCTTLQGECAWRAGASGTQGSFFDSNGDMLVSGASNTHNFLRVMRGNNNAAGSIDDSTTSEAPRVDIFAAARDPEFNRAYFNPTTDYSAWVNWDGTPFLGVCPTSGGCATTTNAGTAITSSIANYIHQSASAGPVVWKAGDVVRSAAPEDPRHPITPTDNSGSPVTIDFTKSVHVTYVYKVGDVIPKGNRILYRTATTSGFDSLGCADLKSKFTATDNTWVTLTADYIIPSTNCTNRIVTTEWYPATVYLTTNTAAGPLAIPGFNYAKVITVPNAGPNGTSLYKYEIIPANFSATADYDAAVQKFANYWTYYADRARAIVAAASQSYIGVTGIRVGKFDISPICSSAGNCGPLNTTAGYTQFISGPDSKYTAQPAGDPLVPMYDMSDNCYDPAVTINPTIPATSPAPCTKTGGGDRAKLYKQIYAFDKPNNNTPTRRAVYRLGHQFTRVTGATTTDGVVDDNPPIKLECQANAGMLFTDGYINDDNGGLPAVGNVDSGTVLDANSAPTSITRYGQSTFTDANANTMADIAAWFYQENLRPDLPAGQAPTDPGCSQSNPAKALDCNPNLHMLFYGIPLGAVGKYYNKVVGGVSYVDNLATAQDEATNAAFQNPPAWAAKGLCNSCTGNTDLSPPAVDDIWHAAINSRGKFISAQSPAAVREGIQNVINALLHAAQPSGSFPVVGVRLGAGSLAFTPSFARTGNDWTGDVVANKINSDGTTGSQVWDAGNQIEAKPNPNRDARNIYINTVAGTSAGHTTAFFDQSNDAALGGSEAAQLAFLGTNSATFHSLYDAAGHVMTVDDVINYLKGDDSREVQNGGKFRNRTTPLGDIVDSTPQASSGKDDFGFSQSLTSPLGGGTTYDNFLLAKSARSPASVLYVGSNDGMLHAFNATTTGGQELFGFIPNSVAPKLSQLLDTHYSHQFYVDGDNTVFDAYLGGVWKTVLVGSPGPGGSGVYALDVSNPASFNAANVMWEQNASTDPDIGSNVGTPLVILGEDNTWYAAFGNGYNSTNSNPALILVNLSTGAVARKLIGNDGGTYDNGIGQIAALDSDGDGKVDTIYGGDYRGNLWKFDLSSTTSGSWTVAYGGVPLYVAKDTASPTPNAQPITGGIELADGPLGGVMVYFGTGSFFLVGDNNITNPSPVQSLYAVWDNGVSPVTTGRTKLVAQTITTAASPRQTTNNPVTYTSVDATTQRGFYMDLMVAAASPPVQDGEKFFGNARVQSGAVFYPTFEPANNQCNPGGNRHLYILNALTGANAASDLVFVSGPNAGQKVCPSGGCGEISLGAGSPVKDTSIVIPPPPCLKGIDPGCAKPPTEDCTTTPGVCVPIPPPPDTYTPCTIVVRAEGADAVAKPRPCGRQSWRQVR